ncbi:Cupredoxin [Multifurca ochricompacta]|uniref:laccase n=1 Tax=Multifurca ochricompacta TaxID=376703 RepID=A0AAD4LUB2_9AGAM|nr:Cupredoxin [Multifurca ochricompacta]
MLQFLYLIALLPVISERAFASLGPVEVLPIINSDIAPDGFRRSAVLANDVFPGPLIKANKVNMPKLILVLLIFDAALHWHGIFQRTTNYADGSPSLLMPNCTERSFLYDSRGRANGIGTYWYHSHLQAQYCDGLRGPLVIYDPDDPQWSFSLDLLLSDDTLLPLRIGTTSSRSGAIVPNSNSTLINGQGRYPGGPPFPCFFLLSIKVEPKVNASCHNSYRLRLVDGNNVQPLVVDSLQIFAAQRRSEIDNYWIRALPNLSDKDYADFTNDPLSDPNVNVPTSLLPLVETNLHLTFTCPATRPTPVPGEPFPGGADININLAVTLSSDFTEFLVNGFPFDSPTVPVLLQILSGAQSAADLVPTGSIYKLEPNKSVEITLPAGVADGPHPIHLHGHAFHVVRSAGSSVYNFDDPVIRDVVSMGKTGDNVTIRFFTDNPARGGFAVVFAEDVPEVSTTDIVPNSWLSLCPAYNNFESQT